MDPRWSAPVHPGFIPPEFRAAHPEFFTPTSVSPVRRAWPGRRQKSRVPQYTTPRRRIPFYDRDAEHYGFTNFSLHPIQYKGKYYPTSEHLFQSLKVKFYCITVKINI